jgi:matrix metalloproteinase-11 (stromelysin 3)
MEAKRVLGLKGQGLELDDTFYDAIVNTPRCGHRDVALLGTNEAAPNQWLKAKATKGLSYNILGVVPNMPKGDYNQEILDSFAIWEQVCGVQFRWEQGNNSADILINVSNSRSEDFGTPGNVLAWAYLPQGSNHTQQLLLKLDLAESWSLNAASGSIDLGLVMRHEIGHLLGLDHTSVASQLMNPIYNPAIPGPQARYDINETVKRYGLPKIQGPTPGPTEPKPKDPDFRSIKVVVDNVFYRLVKEG